MLGYVPGTTYNIRLDDDNGNNDSVVYRYVGRIYRQNEQKKIRPVTVAMRMLPRQIVNTGQRMQLILESRLSGDDAYVAFSDASPHSCYITPFNNRRMMAVNIDRQQFRDPDNYGILLNDGDSCVKIYDVDLIYRFNYENTNIDVAISGLSYTITCRQRDVVRSLAVASMIRGGTIIGQGMTVTAGGTNLVSGSSLDINAVAEAVRAGTTITVRYRPPPVQLPPIVVPQDTVPIFDLIGQNQYQIEVRRTRTGHEARAIGTRALSEYIRGVIDTRPVMRTIGVEPTVATVAGLSVSVNKVRRDIVQGSDWIPVQISNPPSSDCAWKQGDLVVVYRRD